MVKRNGGRVSACDFVCVTTKEGVFEGLVMPSSDKETLVLKLKSGYNAGIRKKSIVKQEKLKDFTGGKEKCETSLDIPYKKETTTHTKGLPTIAVLHTGGTIASEVDYETGGVQARFTPEELLSMFPELKDIANITAVKVMNMMSEDIRFSHYRKLARAIKREIKNGVDGIIVGHGTDTLALTAAALAFMFEHVPLPILVTGSQRSSDRGSSDARLNLLSAAYFIAHSDFKGVGICMHETSDDETCVILPATKTKKLHTSRRDAFKPVNDRALARVHFRKKKIDVLQSFPPVEGKIVVKDGFAEKVAMIKTYPNMGVHILQTMIDKKYQGFVLEGSGIGQAPTNIKENEANYNVLRTFIKGGGVVVLTSNCVFGEVHPHIYKNCRRLEEIGVVFGKDMLTETAFIKLAWLLGNYPKKDVPRLLQENLRGELSIRRLHEEHYEY